MDAADRVMVLLAPWVENPSAWRIWICNSSWPLVLRVGEIQPVVVMASVISVWVDRSRIFTIQLASPAVACRAKRSMAMRLFCSRTS